MDSQKKAAQIQDADGVYFEIVDNTPQKPGTEGSPEMCCC